MPDLSQDDYRRLFELATALLDNPDPPLVWPLVLDRLITDCAGDAGIMNATWSTPDGPAGEAWSPAGALPASAVCKPEDLADHPLACHYLRTADPTPYRISDITTDAGWRASAAYHHQSNKCGVTRELAIRWRPRRAGSASSIIGRSGHDFTDATANTPGARSPCCATWTRVPATDGRRLLGHGVAVCCGCTPNCIDGDEEIANERIARALRDDASGKLGGADEGRPRPSRRPVDQSWTKMAVTILVHDESVGGGSPSADGGVLKTAVRGDSYRGRIHPPSAAVVRSGLGRDQPGRSRPRRGRVGRWRAGRWCRVCGRGCAGGRARCGAISVVGGRWRVRVAAGEQ